MNYVANNEIRSQARGGFRRLKGQFLADGDLPVEHIARLLADGAISVVTGTPAATDTPASVASVIDATDAAASLADTLGVDLSEIEGSGTGGRIIVGDVREAAGED
jgi:pyruvate/2-oxoglutarate dehydrogenase complex dihydrolipoamide acyltransferase (E2) component